ncbi:hypothetical protein HYPSUDRAFT_129664 [Hypholoma sublateritium FD-334 SS-4]|uniref:Uncharacterized protein n=1 Tax=Hypholoma sublateritium (strain FD-334 SS-4) TaxID=945553 RepID=A0A0D2MVT6_HYPSF|nr:hypothetical protein HYPSUDRAFT_129664 [Hypholoma sublateritium FD-334 SS-4]
MPVFPHSRVFVGQTKVVDITGPHIQILDKSTGDVLLSSAGFPEEQQQSVLKSGLIRCAAVDSQMKYLLTSGEDKILKLWGINDLKLINERELPKKPTAVAFTSNAETIVVSDKFGDIFSYPFAYTLLSEDERKDKEKAKPRDALSSHENPSDGQLILGHASPLNAFIFTADEKFIVTADRDEHIRVSWFPKGYNIEMYCLGHLKFVSAIHIPKTDPSTLISGGGDPMLKIWDWATGLIKHSLPVLDAVEPFIVIRASKKRRGEDDDEGAPEGAGKKSKSQRRKENKKNANLKSAEVAGEEPSSSATATAAPEKLEEESKLEKILVIHRIESIDSDSGPYIVFSAVGATAIFAFPYRMDVLISDIQSFDFGRPVLDFSVVNGSKLVVILDGAWVAEGSPADSDSHSMVKVVNVSVGRFTKFKGITTKSAFRFFMFFMCNSMPRFTANAESLKKIDLYSDLVSLPKYADPDVEENNEGAPMPIGAPEISSSETAKAKGKAKAELSKKEIGRIKTKQAVLAKAMEVDGGKLGAEGAEEDGPAGKKARAEAAGPTSETESRDGDVQMAAP